MSSFDLKASYRGFTLDARARWDASCAALFGASGSGKSTVLEALAGLRREVRGSIELGGRRIDGMPARRRRVGWVPQDAALFPHLSAAENIRFGRPRVERAGPLPDVVSALEIEALLERPARELSGGERQRVAIARALASNPSVLLLDEPLASIDRPLRARMLPYLQALPERTGVPLFLVTHDPLEVVALAQEVLVIESGRIVATGTPEEVFASAATFGALHALGAENRFPVRVLERGPATFTVETEGGCRLSMVRVRGFPDPERVAVRGEDVMLAAQHPGVVSAQNVFEATVRHLELAGEQVTVELSGAGETWRVRVTPRARESLQLERGRGVYLLIKAHAIVPA